MLVSFLSIVQRLVFIPLLVLFFVHNLIYATPEGKLALFLALSLGICLMGEAWKHKYGYLEKLVDPYRYSFDAQG